MARPLRTTPKSPAGKGDCPRPTDMARFRRNFESINWNSKKREASK